MTASLRHLLTATPISAGNGKPLFKSGFELGSLIAKIEAYPSEGVENGRLNPNPYFGRVQTTVSMVNQLMRGECSASDDFLGILVYLVTERLREITWEARKIWILKIKEAVGAISMERKGIEYYKEVMDFGFKRAERADHFMLLYSSISPFSSDFYSLRDVMIPLLALTPEISKPSAVFSFYYAEGADLYETWHRMFRDAVGINYASDYTPFSFNPDSKKIDFDYGIEKTIDHFESIEASQHLQTFLIPEYVVSVPMIALDPLKEDPAVFVGFADEQLSTGLRVMSVPDPYLSRWITQIAKPLLKEEIIGMRPSYFSAVKDRIVKEIYLDLRLGKVPDYTLLIERFEERCK